MEISNKGNCTVDLLWPWTGGTSGFTSFSEIIFSLWSTCFTRQLTAALYMLDKRLALMFVLEENGNCYHSMQSS